MATGATVAEVKAEIREASIERRSVAGIRFSTRSGWTRSSCLWCWGSRGIKLREFRFAVGSKEGPKSTVWKCWVQGDETYISSRLFGSQAKISLHSSGQCQWSYTDTWVHKAPIRRNADRHIAKWSIAFPQDDTALLAFRVAVPISELRSISWQAGQKKAMWVGNAPAESTVEFCFYFTRAFDALPTTDGNPALRHLASLQLRNRRWFVVFARLQSLSTTDIAAARQAAIAQARDAGIQVHPDFRLALFALPTTQHCAGLLEVSATDCP